MSLCGVVCFAVCGRQVKSLFGWVFLLAGSNATLYCLCVRELEVAGAMVWLRGGVCCVVLGIRAQVDFTCESQRCHNANHHSQNMHSALVLMHDRGKKDRKKKTFHLLDAAPIKGLFFLH